MTQIVVSIGSNIERCKNMQYALQQLRLLYGTVNTSPLYETSAVGFKGPDFYNFTAYFDSSLTIKTIQDQLHAIESKTGRTRKGNRFANRTLDIDILLFGHANLTADGIDVPRAEILVNAHVLKPLSDLLPHFKHPITGNSFIEAWQSFDDTDARIKQISASL